MKSSLTLASFLILSILLSGCSSRDFNSSGQGGLWCTEHDHLPVYPAAQTDKVTKGEPETCALLATSDFASINNWYLRALEKSGWQIWLERNQKVEENSPAKMYLLEKGNRQITLFISQPLKGQKTNIVFTVISGKILHNTYDLVDAGKARAPSAR